MTTKDYAEFTKIYEQFHDEFKIQEILIEKKNFHFPLYEARLYIDGDTSFGITIATKVLSGEKFLIFKTIEVIFKSKNGNPIADFNLIISFELSKENDKKSGYLIEGQSGYKIQSFANEFLDHIVIATTRGILFSEFQGTFIHKAILPLTKPSLIKSKDY